MKARHYFELICTVLALVLLFSGQAALAGLLCVLAMAVEILGLPSSLASSPMMV